jgi:flagellar export protein FliJ
VKVFHFPLHRALHIRRAQLELERIKYQRLMRDREQLELQVTAIQVDAADTRSAIATRTHLLPGEISTMPDYLRGARQRLRKLDELRKELANRLQEQQRQMVEAERKVKLLEKLRTRRFGEWENEMLKEQETFAADAYLARWSISS